MSEEDRAGNERLATLEVKLSSLLDQIPALFDRQSEIASALQRIDGHLTASMSAIEKRIDASDRLQLDHEDRIRALERYQGKDHELRIRDLESAQGKNGRVISVIERCFWIFLAGAVGVASRMFSQ